MNRKKLYRLYREEKLMVRRRGGRKRALGTRAPMLLPDTINRRRLAVQRCTSSGRCLSAICTSQSFDLVLWVARSQRGAGYVFSNCDAAKGDDNGGGGEITKPTILSRSGQADR
jgi:hypothetical protein